MRSVNPRLLTYLLYTGTALCIAILVYLGTVYSLNQNFIVNFIFCGIAVFLFA